ncbi:endonuclease [Roseovarius aestuarii]|nr:endonuclease [Roseovarius aestuarii]
MTQDHINQDCRTKCLLAAAALAVLALILLMTIFGAGFLVALLIAVVAFFVLAYVLPGRCCCQEVAEIAPQLTPEPTPPPAPDAPVEPKPTAAAKSVPAAAAVEPATAAASTKPAAAKPAADKTVVKKAATKKPATKKTAPKAARDTGGDAPAGTKPEMLSAARAGGPDDLKMIKGVGPKLETLLHSMGFYHYDQIAGWSADEIAWVDQNLQGFKGRVSRDDWVAQAKLLASGGETEFSKRASKGGVYK